MNNFLVFDIENNSSKVYGRKAGFFLVDPIVAIGLYDGSKAISHYIYPDKITEFKIDEDVLVGHNIKHDLLFIWHLEDLQDFFRRGGKVWDTMLAEYIITGQQSKYAKLRDLAVNKYGCPERTKHIDDLLFKNPNSIYKQVSDLPPELVCEDVRGDVENTGDVYIQQVEEATKQGILPLIEGHMDALLATTEMEYNGFKVDDRMLRDNRRELEIELDRTEKEAMKIISKYWK